MFLFITLTVLFIGGFDYTKTEVSLFTSTLKLTNILKLQEQIVKDINDYIVKEEARLEQLKRVEKDYHRHVAAVGESSADYAGHPINSFHLVRRLVQDWRPVAAEKIFSNASVVDFLGNFSAQAEKEKAIHNSTHPKLFMEKGQDFWQDPTLVTMPSDSDMAGAAAALFRLQTVYNIPTAVMASGKIPGAPTVKPLNALECMDLAKLASRSTESLYYSMEWIEHAVSLAKQGDGSVEVNSALDMYAYITFKRGNIQHAINLTSEMLANDPNNTRAQNNLEIYKRKQEELKTPEHTINNEKNLPFVDTDKPFNRLCQKKFTTRRRLHCHYRRHHPAFYIAPLKEEVFSLKPWIAMYHDFVNEYENVQIRNISSGKLTRALVLEGKTHNPSVSDIRVSESAWLADDLYPAVNHLSTKLEWLTNLTKTTSELLQVANYGMAGQVYNHHDHGVDREDMGKNGNRLLTAMIYLSDVTTGGHTVFPSIQIKIKPVRNAVVLWYNLHKSGKGIEKMDHGGCPVVTGSKWVCNKWFHEHGNEFRRSCGLSEYQL